ncbi:7 transmembrane sweet-taste receptor of 3 GCPR-domain-containing protein, partial [Chytridium lagenaria]
TRVFYCLSGFGLVWGNILAKGIRIYRLFNNTSGRTIMITNSAVFTWVGGIGGVEIFLSLIYTVVNGPKPVLIERADFLEWTCQSQSASFDRTMMAAFIVYNSLLILGGVVVAFLTRNVASDYNESQVLGYTTFTFTIVTLITTPIFSVSGLSYRARFVLFAAMIFILTGIIMFLFCGSKVVSLAREFGVLAKHQQSSQYEPVTASILKERSAQRMTPKDGETKAEAMFVTRLFCLLPGLASRWIECTIICSPTQDLLVVSNHEQGSNVFERENVKLHRHQRSK